MKRTAADCRAEVAQARQRFEELCARLAPSERAQFHAERQARRDAARSRAEHKRRILHLRLTGE